MTREAAAARRKLLDRADAAEYLGVSRRYIDALIASGELPAFGLPSTRTRGNTRMVRVDQADLDELLVPVRSAKAANG
jgi:excisionase family DNA binding protein